MPEVWHSIWCAPFSLRDHFLLVNVPYRAREFPLSQVSPLLQKSGGKHSSLLCRPRILAIRESQLAITFTKLQEASDEHKVQAVPLYLTDQPCIELCGASTVVDLSLAFVVGFHHLWVQACPAYSFLNPLTRHRLQYLTLFILGSSFKETASTALQFVLIDMKRVFILAVMSTGPLRNWMRKCLNSFVNLEDTNNL